MATQSFVLTCLEKILVAPGVYQLTFRKPEDFVFKAGQFVLFDVPLAERPHDIQPRAYSIASAPNEEELLFVVKLKEGGRASLWVEQVLNADSTVRIQGPFGLFTLKPEEKSCIFIATGAGNAPFRSQITQALLYDHDMRPLFFLFGVREEIDLFWHDHFLALQKKFPNFQYLPTLSGVDVGSWKGLRGRVQMHLPSVVQRAPNSGIYICGAPDMVKETKELCINQLQIPKAKVHAEGYI